MYGYHHLHVLRVKSKMRPAAADTWNTMTILEKDKQV